MYREMRIGTTEVRKLMANVEARNAVHLRQACDVLREHETEDACAAAFQHLGRVMPVCHELVVCLLAAKGPSATAEPLDAAYQAAKNLITLPETVKEVILGRAVTQAATDVAACADILSSTCQAVGGLGLSAINSLANSMRKRSLPVRIEIADRIARELRMRIRSWKHCR